MKKLFNYNTYNESIRDKMTPKSRGDIYKILNDKMSKVTPGKEENAKYLFGCEQGLLWVVKEALIEGADINYEYGYLLVIAAHSGSVEVVEYILNKGISTKYIHDAINVAISAGHKEVAEVLNKFGYDKENK